MTHVHTVYLFYSVSTQEFLHSGNMTEAGPMDLIDDNDDENDNNQPSLLKGNYM